MTLVEPRFTFGTVAREFGTQRGRVRHLRRLLACLGGGLVLALMVGQQSGNQNDFLLGFHDAWFKWRVLIFLAIGLIIYALVTLWPLVAPYVERPGMKALGAGLVLVIVSQTVLNWYDPLDSSSLGNRRFGKLTTAVDATGGLDFYTQPFFDWLAWTLLAATAVLVLAAVIARRAAADDQIGNPLALLRPFAGWVAAVLGVLGAVLAYLAHRDVLSYGGIDHSFGMWADIIGFLVLAGAGVTAQLAKVEVSDTRGFLTRVTSFRPGLVPMVIALVWGLLVFGQAGWFGVGPSLNYTLMDASTNFRGTGLAPLATQYLAWLGWTLFGACMVAGVAAAWLRNAALASAAAALAVAGVIITFVTIKAMTEVGAKVAPQFGTTWNNLGVGGFAACMVFSLVGAAMAQAISAAKATRASTEQAHQGEAVAAAKTGKPVLPFSQMVAGVKRSANNRALLILVIAVAVFYPPTLVSDWQSTLVTQIGPYLLLAIGLNVVVGWAGLLDLGYIAFYEIGSYTTAYFTGSLPIKPPSWLHPFQSPLWSIPFAILFCLVAGVILGAPTLRLRGDYLAIVTLGFGEIIQVLGTNLKGITGGPQGPTVNHPRLDLGFLKIQWGQDNLPYWYLLLVMLAVVIILFYRLENSRLGRAWAAIREDEVAAQASGVNTTRVKLLAFAIGASTSGLAGVFFATQIGYFDPTLFTLQASILIVAYVVFGGMGSLYGAMAGAAVLTWLPQFLKSQVPIDDRQMWVGALVLAMMIFRPAGLIPAKRRKAELEGLDGTSSSEVRAVPASEGL